MNILCKRCCDFDKSSKNTDTVREWIHETYKAIYHEDISDTCLDSMRERELRDFIEELDWLASK